MPAPYTTEELVALHKRSLQDTASLFNAAADADFVRHLRIAARAVSERKRTRTLPAALTVASGQSLYDAPADLLEVKIGAWGVAEQHTAPWNAPRGPLPSLRRVENPATGLVQIQLSPAPSAAQIDCYGPSYPYYYLAMHLVPDTGASTVTDRELDLVLLRAKVEAMRELSIRNHNKPVTLRAAQGLGDAVLTKNMTAPALYAQLLQEYNETP